MDTSDNNVEPAMAPTMPLSSLSWAAFLSHCEEPFVANMPVNDDDGGVIYVSFWLPRIDKFLEVNAAVDPLHVAKLTGKQVVFTAQLPQLPPGATYLPDQEWKVYTPDGGVDYRYCFCCCPHCKRLGLEFDGRADRIKCNCPKSEHGDKGYNTLDPYLLRAYKFAQRVSDAYLADTCAQCGGTGAYDTETMARYGDEPVACPLCRGTGIHL